MDTGLLIVRIVAGLLFAGHGTQKLFGWFGGHGLAGTGGAFEKLGFRPGKPMAGAAGLGELGGGILLALGLLTPIVAAAVIGVMVNAVVAAHLGKGPWAMNGGWELPVLYGAVAAALAFVGPGAYSVDNAVGWTLAGDGWGVAALVIGCCAGLVTLAVRASNRTRDARGGLGQAA